MTALDDLFADSSNDTETEVHLEDFNIEFSSETDLLINAIELLGTTVKGDENLIYQILFNGFSAFMSKPTHLMVMERTSEGKTYPALQVAQYFPKEHVIKLGSVTPQAFKYELGTLVDKDYNPIQSRLDNLDEQIGKENKKKNSKVKELKKRKQDLLKNSKTVIDLRNKWIIFKEPPDPKLLEGLYSTLSSDEEFNEHKFVNHSNGDGNKSFTVVFRGTPAILICTAKDETKSARWSETFTRFNIVSPIQSPAKYKQGMDLIGKSWGLPKELYDEQVINDEQRRRLGAIITQFIKRIHESKGEIFNPFQDVLNNKFPHDAGYRWRQYQRFNSLLNIHCFCYSSDRPKLLISGRKVPIITKADVRWAIETIRESEIIPPNKLKWFKEVFTETFKNKKQSVNFGTEKNPLMRDSIICGDLVLYTKEKELGKVTTKQLRENYLDTLLEHGVIECDKDPRNKSRHAYWISENYLDGKQSSFISITSLDETCVKLCLDKYLKKRFTFDFHDKPINYEEVIQLILCEHNLTSMKNATSSSLNIPDYENGEMAISGDSIPTLLDYDTNVKEKQSEIGYSREKKSEHTHFLCYTCNPRGAGVFRLDEKHPANQKPMLECHFGHDLRFLTSKEAIEEIWSAKYKRSMKQEEIIAILNSGGGL